MLARVRWNNVVLTVVVLGVVGLVVGWPLLGSSDIELPPPVAAVKPAVVVPTVTASPTPVRRAPRPRKSRVAPVKGREGGLGGQVRKGKLRKAAKERPTVAPTPTVATTAVAPTVVATAPLPAAPVAPPEPAPAPKREFGGFER